MQEWNTASSSNHRSAKFMVNGREYQVDPVGPDGMPTSFDKAVVQIAKEGGLEGRFYVKCSMRPDDPAIFITPENAPRTVTAGMVVSITPHSQGA